MARRTAENANVSRDPVKRWKQSGLSARAFADFDGGVVTSLSDVGRTRSEVGIVVPIEVMVGDYRVVVRTGCDLLMLEGVLRAVERAR